MTRSNLHLLLFVAMAVVVVAIAPGAAADDSLGHTTLTIKGMTCGGCVGAVKAQLKKTPGVTEYDVSLEKGEAAVTYDPSATSPDTIAASVSKTGFEATVKSADQPAK